LGGTRKRFSVGELTSACREGSETNSSPGRKGRTLEKGEVESPGPKEGEGEKKKTRQKGRKRKKRKNGRENISRARSGAPFRIRTKDIRRALEG